jgi:threonine aldolase
MRIVDLRSDTVTKPSPDMWEAIKSMNNSMLGDDVEKEDPTVNELEKKAAKLVGKPKALLVASGTQGNLTSMLSQTNPGEEILLEERSHIFKWEVSGMARIGGLLPRTFSSNKGVFNPDDLISSINSESDEHHFNTSLIAIENTHNYHGGIALKPELFQVTRKFADEFNLKVHLDGARIFNSCIAQNLPITEFTQFVDSIQFCLSKGLSCPIGSIIAGSEEFIRKARLYRKMLGGGWRQAGIIASMGLIALEQKWINRLEEDHKNARLIKNLLMDGKGNLPINVPTPDTNILLIEFTQTINESKLLNMVNDLNKNGVLCFDMGPRIRLVTHYGITEDDIQYCTPIIHQTLKNHFA